MSELYRSQAAKSGMVLIPKQLRMDWIDIMGPSTHRSATL